MLLHGSKSRYRFAHTRLNSGVFVSVCEQDGWLAASACLENLTTAENAHIQGASHTLEHHVLEDGRCEWICRCCGSVIVTTSDEAVLADAERSHKCTP